MNILTILILSIYEYIMSTLFINFSKKAFWNLVTVLIHRNNSPPPLQYTVHCSFWYHTMIWDCSASVPFLIIPYFMTGPRTEHWARVTNETFEITQATQYILHIMMWFDNYSCVILGIIYNFLGKKSCLQFIWGLSTLFNIYGLHKAFKNFNFVI